MRMVPSVQFEKKVTFFGVSILFTIEVLTCTVCAYLLSPVNSQQLQERKIGNLLGLNTCNMKSPESVIWII